MITPSEPAQKTISCSRHAPINAAFHPQRRLGRVITFLADCFAGRHTGIAIDKVEPMMTRFAVATAAVLVGFGAAHAQAPMSTSPLPALGVTSPLGIPNAPVGHTGIPLGATELATPGVSPTTSGVSPLLGVTCGGVSSVPPSAAMGSSLTGASADVGTPVTGASAGMGGSVPGTSGTAPFDGGGMAASAPGACAASATASPPLASSMGPGSSVGMVGIPLGSTELGSGGLSPPSVALSPNASAPAITLTPLPMPSNPSAPLSTPQSTASCPTTQTGVPTISGVPTTFGSPLTGRALGAEATRCP